MRPAKVFHVITRMIRGGAQRVVLQLLERIDRAHYQQALVTGVEAGAEGTLLPEAQALTVPIFTVPSLVRNVAPLQDFHALAHLAGLFAKHKPDIVHCHTYKAGIVGCLAARLAGIRRIVFTPHGHIFDREAHIPGVPSDGLGARALYWLTRWGEQCATKITALSQEDLRAQRALGLAPPHKYCVIPNGIDLARFQMPTKEERRHFCAQRNLTSSAPLLGTVGRLTSEKGHRYLISAMATVKQHFPHAKLLLMGDGALDSELRNLAAKQGVQEHVLFMGGVENILLPLSVLDVYVHPSLYESQGLAIMEAMALRKPVVATRVGGVADVVQDKATGLLVPPQDAGALATATLTLLKDRNIALQYGEAGYERIKQHFSLSAVVRSYEGLYEELLTRR